MDDSHMQSQLEYEKSELPYILIVEDDRALAKLLDDVMRIAGLHSFVIRSKQSAERFLRRVRPDLVIIDYQLIGGVGLEAAQIASNMNVPVIVISGHWNIAERVGKAGHFYLKKPFAPWELMALMSRILGVDLGWSADPTIALQTG